MTKVKTIIFSGLFLAISSCRTDSGHLDIKALPDQGIEIEGKSFLLYRTSLKQTLSYFNIKDTLTEYSSTAEVFDSEGNSVPCIETSQKRLDYKNLSFYFTGHHKDSLELNVIEIRLNGPLTVDLDGKQIDNTFLQIPNKFPNSIRFPIDGDDIHSTLFQIYSCDFGITFWVDSVQNNIELSRIFIQKKTE